MRLESGIPGRFERQFAGQFVQFCAGELGANAAKELLRRRPELGAMFRPQPEKKWSENLATRALDLSAALDAGRPELFARQVAWSGAAFAARGVPIEALRASVEVLRDTTLDAVPEEDRDLVRACFEAGLATLATAHPPAPSELRTDSVQGRIAAEYMLAVLEGDRVRAARAVREAVRSGRISFQDAYLEVLVPVQRELGRMWHMNEIGVAEEHFATATTQMVMSQLLAEAPRAPFDGRVMIGASVEGNAHDVGVRIVSDLFEVAGWRAIYLGPGVPVSDLVQAAEDFRADLIALSASLVTHVRGVEEAVRGVRGRGLRPTPKIIVGGRAFEGCPDLATECGADAHASSPLEAVAMGERLVPRRSA